MDFLRQPKVWRVIALAVTALATAMAAWLFRPTTANGGGTPDPPPPRQWLAISSPWTASVSETEGLLVVSKGGSSALTASFGFWGRNWAWANMESQFKVVAPLQYSLATRNQLLDFALTAAIRKASNRQMVWEFDLDTHSTSREVVGGGLVFKFDLATFGDEMGEPVLLADNRGWAWGRPGGSRLEMRFEPALASVYFERGNKNEIRAFFYQGTVPQGQQRRVATLSLSSDMLIAPTTGERFGLADPSRWPPDNLDWRTAPVDLSFLNEREKPAGRRGFVRVAGGRLVFADGTPARFWGTNLTAAALFGTTGEAARVQAQRLSELGFNLVRLHHHDSAWVSPNIFDQRKSARDTGSLSAESLDRLDWWIKCLKDAGIYVWLDLHVGRALTAADGIWSFEEISKGKGIADLRGYNFVNLTIQQAMKRFNEAYVSHINPYTGVAYKDEPAIAAMLITNENDITWHFGNALLPDKQVPEHNKVYMSEAAGFARAHDLPKESTWRSWEHGPSKLFLNDLEHRFDAAMIAHLRQLGVKVPVATTSSWGSEPLSSLPALTSGDLIDVHAYAGAGELEKNPLLAPTLVHWMAAGRVSGMPMSVSEWNAEPFPTADRHSLPLYVAGTACHQGWDAMMQYAYSQVPFDGPGNPSNWHAFNDPALIATLPAAALMYRQGHVREADIAYVFAPSPRQLFYQNISAANSPALRTASEKGKLLIAMPRTRELQWLVESGPPPKRARVFTDPAKPLIEANAKEVASDTGELRRQWDKGLYTINTPRTQATTGWIGGQSVTLPDVEVNVTTRNASVVVQSLDGLPIAQSGKLLISLAARAVPKAGNQTPFHTEPVEGRLLIRAPPGLRLFRKAILQQRKEVPIRFERGRYVIELDDSLRTNWLTLEGRNEPATPPSAPAAHRN